MIDPKACALASSDSATGSISDVDSTLSFELFTEKVTTKTPLTNKGQSNHSKFRVTLLLALVGDRKSTKNNSSEIMPKDLSKEVAGVARKI